MTTETIEKLNAKSLPARTLETLLSRPLFPEIDTDLDYFLQPDGHIIRVSPADYRNPQKKTYPDAVPIIWQEWLRGEGGGPGTLMINDSTVIASTGLKGSGKSLLLAWLGAKALAIGMPVWSNMGIKLYLFTDENQLELLESKKLDWNAFLMLSSELEHGAVVIDELSYYASSRQSSSVRNRILNSIVNQVRKRALDFYVSVKFLRQIDVNVRDEISAEFACEDLALRPKGQAMRLPRGCFIGWCVRDISGWSGHPISRRGLLDFEPLASFVEHDQPIYANRGIEKIFSGRPFWPIYDSYEVVNMLDAFRKIRLDLNDMVITDKRGRDDVIDTLYACADIFREVGELHVPCDDFRQAAAGAGLNLSDQKLGALLGDISVPRVRSRSGSYYDISNSKQGFVRENNTEVK